MLVDCCGIGVGGFGEEGLLVCWGLDEDVVFIGLAYGLVLCDKDIVHL